MNDKLKDKLKKDAEAIYSYAIRENLPDSAVQKALLEMPMPKGRLILVAIGKAAWQMAHKAYEILGTAIDSGIVITKHEHSQGAIGNLEIYEAGHPVPDECGINATRRALEITAHLTSEDTVLFLVSGGGSALFESVDCTLSELRDLTSQLLASGASIGEINAVRKHLSNVKGGRFAAHVYPASVYAVVLSDVIGNRLDMIASGPTAPDATTVSEVDEIIKGYSLNLTDTIKALLARETPKTVSNATHVISGSVTELCAAAHRKANKLGYDARILDDGVTLEAREVGAWLAALANEHKDTKVPLAFIIGGETVVRLRGKGLGGRNQEIALSGALGIDKIENACIFSVGSDGTDGPTDAAGGYADGNTVSVISSTSKSALSYLENNDSYNALKLSQGLIMTGPTGTNVNDFAAVLILPN